MLGATNGIPGSLVLFCSQQETFFASGGTDMPTNLKRWKSSALGLIAAFTWPTWALAESFEFIAPTETSIEVTEVGVRVELNQNGCAVGHEAACDEAYQRSEYVSTQSHKHGDRVTYSWEVMVPSDFSFSRGYLRSGRLLYGSGKPIFSFFLDTESGYTVNTRACFGPEGFGEWHAVEVRVAWDSTKKKSFTDRTPGDLLVLCNGVEVYSQSGRPNIISAEEEVWFALGLHGALKLADGDNAKVLFRNISIENQ